MEPEERGQQQGDAGGGEVWVGREEGRVEREVRAVEGGHGAVEEAVQVAGVAARHARSADHVLQDQVPADHEGRELAHRHVAEQRSI